MQIGIDLHELEEIADNRMKTLFISCVGSHMWGMNSPESDIDLVMIYIAPTRSLLRGEKIMPTVRQQITARGGEIYDTLGWEIGHLINQLIKGNVNAIWYVTSPLLVKPSILQEELSALVRANLCRQTFHSIKGMAESQIKSEEKPADKPGIAGKGYRTALRTINFGIKLLLEGKICFAPVLSTPGKEAVMEKLQRLDEAYASSLLPDWPDEDVFRDFLMRQRLEDMVRAENIGIVK
ncbi:MAG: nucleotidyltransferase domain-containing protein [Methanothrix sp.]|nr:nucleotidyltransferase domain-containing protein [Methanothrix sp.]